MSVHKSTFKQFTIPIKTGNKTPLSPNTQRKNTYRYIVYYMRTTVAISLLLD